MLDAPQLVGGPADGTILPERYVDSPRIQMPIHDDRWNFATYVRDPDDSSRFVFDGFAE
jgi:hypothetical protein